MDTDKFYVPRLRRLKWVMFGLTAVSIAAVEAYYYFIREVPLIEDVVDWLIGMVIAVVLIEIAFRAVGKLQNRLQQEITQREHAEETLRNEKLFLDALMDNIVDSVYFKDKQSRFIKINRKLMRDLQIDDMYQAIGKTDMDFFGEEFGQKTMADEHRIISTDEPLVDETELRQLPDGQVIWTSSTKVPMRDAEGQITGIVGITRDITKHMEAEDALRRSEALYRTLIENLRQNIFLKDTALRFVSANSSFCNLLGVRPDDIIGKSDYDFFPKNLAEKYRGDDKEVLETGRPLELIEENVVGNRKRWVEVVKTPVKDAEGKVTGVLGIFWDVTERRETEMQLRELATTDSLTRLYNRGHFMILAERELSRTKRHGHTLSLLMIDIDRFKSVNDTYGHDTGDEVLQGLGETGRRGIRDDDILGRVGGEEFAVLLPETDLTGAWAVAERLRHGVANTPIPTSKGPLAITVSVGVATTTKETADLRTLLKSADAALYTAKENGRNRVETCRS